MVYITFENPIYLWYLVSLPFLIVSHFYFLRYAKFRGMRFANFDALKRVTGQKILTKNLSVLFLRIVILICLIAAVAGPVLWYSGQSSENDFVIAIDVSASMTAQDIEPNRLEAAKNAGIVFIDNLENKGIHSKIGLITFSGNTYIEETLTEDYITLKEKIAAIEVRQEGGTDIAGAVITGTNLLQGTEKGKALVLISDGSITVSSIEERVLDNSITYARESRVMIHTLGLGSNTGPLGYLPEFYNASSIFNEETLINLANSTQGLYRVANTKIEVDNAYLEFANSSSEAMLNKDLSYGLLLICLFLVFTEWGLTSTRFRRIT